MMKVKGPSKMLTEITNDIINCSLNMYTVYNTAEKNTHGTTKTKLLYIENTQQTIKQHLEQDTAFLAICDLVSLQILDLLHIYCT